MRLGSSSTRVLATFAAGTFAAAALAACSNGGAATQSSGPSGSAAATPTGAVIASGAPAGSNGDPCALVTAADVQAAFGQTVTKITRMPVSSDSEGTSQQCIFATDGAAPTGPAADLLVQMATAFGAGGGSSSFDSAGIGVILIVATGAQTPEPVDPSELPPGAKVISGLGDFAVAVSSPLSAGGAAICAVGNRAMVVLAIEGRATPTGEMEALLRSGVARL